MKTDPHPPLLRVGVLGCGMISADHLRAWSRCTGATVVAVCDPQRERAEGRAREFGIAAFYTSPEAMFDAEKLDLVDIITSRQTHADMVRLAAKHKVHALCEKPLCPTLAEAESLVREVGEDIRVMVNENWRFRAYFRKIGEWLRAGKLGTVVQARIALWRSNLLRREDGSVIALQRQPFVAHEPRYLIAESLIHEIDTARSLFGEMEVLASSIGRASADIIGEDVATMVMRTSYGLTVVIDGVLSAAGHAPRAPDRVEIAGTRCSVLLENGVLRLYGAEAETHTYDEDAVRQASFDDSIQHFVDQARNGGQYWTSAVDQLGTLKLVENAYELADGASSLTAQRLPPTTAPAASAHVAAPAASPTATVQAA